MKNANQYRNPVPATIAVIACPACNKKRLKKCANEDGTVSPADTTTVDVRGEERFLEVCEHCIAKYRKADERFVMNNMNKLSKAFTDPNKEPDTDSDHKDFSLN
jgi:hypothetical protein